MQRTWEENSEGNGQKRHTQQVLFHMLVRIGLANAHLPETEQQLDQGQLDRGQVDGRREVRVRMLFNVSLQNKRVMRLEAKDYGISFQISLFTRKKCVIVFI